MKVPNLIDLDIKDKPSETKGFQENYSEEITKRKIQIEEKISKLESKIAKFSLKEGMLEKIINATYAELEQLEVNNFKARGQKQTVLLKQLEALSVLQDTIVKYEEMIIKYQKMLIDAENNKFSNLFKLEQLNQKEEETEKTLAQILENLQMQLNLSSEGNSISLVEEIENELKEDGY